MATAHGRRLAGAWPVPGQASWPGARSGLCHDVRMATTSPVEVEPDLTPDEITLTQKPWVTIVWNDPVNLMSYVTYVFRTYFGYDQKKAEKLMLEVHHDGKSMVSNGSREEMERDVQAMHEYGLWATLEKQ
jgi:ATP-dependent Clp protease adaptor protein ClpS